MQIPNGLGGESTGSTKVNPFALPDAYRASQHKNVCLQCYLWTVKIFVLKLWSYIWSDLCSNLNEIVSSLQQNNLREIRQLLREASLEESRKRELSSALHVYFKEWLYGNYHSFSFLWPWSLNLFTTKLAISLANALGKFLWYLLL